jgi:hypothetical protein
MRPALETDADNVTLCADALRAIQLRLETLAHLTQDYPLKCSLGAYDLLFESRDDIEILIESLAEELSEAGNAA